MTAPIRRLQYVALKAPDPAAAATFATEKLGFELVNVDAASRHYLKAQGPDAYSVIYVPGEGPGLDHVGYQIHDDGTLDAAAAQLTGNGVEVTKVDDLLFSQSEAVVFETPAGHQIRLATGAHCDVPPAHAAPPEGRTAPAPIAADHIGLGAIDFEAEEAFWAGPAGTLLSSWVTVPNGPRVMTFLRAPGGFLFHVVVVVRMPINDVHHVQFSLKNLDEFYAARDALEAAGVEIRWGPLRHGNAHNVAMYFQDSVGYWFEYSVDEEVILDDDNYVPRDWDATDPHAADEWREGPTPPPELVGPPV